MKTSKNRGTYYSPFTTLSVEHNFQMKGAQKNTVMFK